MSITQSNKIPPETEVEVIAIKNGKYFKRIMTLQEARVMDKKPGFQYLIYQLGFSAFKTEN